MIDWKSIPREVRMAVLASGRPLVQAEAAVKALCLTEDGREAALTERLAQLERENGKLGATLDAAEKRLKEKRGLTDADRDAIVKAVDLLGKVNGNWLLVYQADQCARRLAAILDSEGKAS